MQSEGTSDSKIHRCRQTHWQLMQNMMALQTEMFLDVEVRHQRFMGVITIILFPTETVPSIVQWDSYEVYLKFETNYDIELT